MLIYGTAILAVCHVIGDYAGSLIGVSLGVKANIGGVAVAMILLIAAKEYLAKKGHLPQSTQFGVLYWSGIYIPIVVAMSAGQNVVAALSGGLAGIIVSITILIGTAFVIRWLNKLNNDYDDFEWTNNGDNKGT